MLIRAIMPEDKERYNSVVKHPLQSYEWGEFRTKMGVKMIRLGVFENNKLISAVQFSIHRVPLFGFKVGYLPKGPYPTKELLEALTKFGKDNGCVFIQIEPNQEAGGDTKPEDLTKKYKNFRISRKPLFTKFTFYIDLGKSEDELLMQMKEKTRYNVRLAQKKGVVVSEENSSEAFDDYLKLLNETAKRDRFFAHNYRYHKTMWEALHPSKIARLLIARYNGVPLVAWVVFVWHNFLYYTYGASSSKYRDVMASNLMYFEAMKFGKKNGLNTFDLWGSLGPNPDPKDPFYGFHRFKEGYNGRLVEFVGSFDLVLNSTSYNLYHQIDKLRWKILNLRRSIPI